MEVDSEEYKSHIVFKNLNAYIDFYDSFSMSIMGFISMGTRAICNIDTYVYSSIQGTLESILNSLVNGRINDAYSLLRKYHDSAIINIYSNLYLKDNFSIENFVVAQINNWLQGKEKLPEYRVMSSYIRSSEAIRPINDLLYKDDTYKKIRDRCNDHVHYNFYENILLNDGRIYLKNRKQVIDCFLDDLENIFILHLAYIFYLHDHYMASSDYIDSLDCGYIPVEDSQYYVAPFIQSIFDETINVRRPDIVSLIRAKTSMDLR
jgi:hypothetical protein